MTATIKRVGLAAAATAVAVSLAGGAYGASQDNPGQDPRPGGRSGRFGGPGGMGPGGHGGGRGGGPGGMLPLMALGRLELTDAQKEQVKTIFESHQVEIKAIGDRARAAHLALDAAVTGPTFDEATVRARAAEVAVVDADAAVARARGFNEVYQILTAEQQAKLQEIQANMQKRMANGPAGRGRGGR